MNARSFAEDVIAGNLGQISSDRYWEGLGNLARAFIELEDAVKPPPDAELDALVRSLEWTMGHVDRLAADAITQLRTALAAAQGRAENAERERDAAVADNAALLIKIREINDRFGMSLLGDPPGDHPGAALLERVRVLEAVRETSTAYLLSAAGVAGPEFHAWQAALDAADRGEENK